MCVGLSVLSLIVSCFVTLISCGGYLVVVTPGILLMWSLAGSVGAGSVMVLLSAMGANWFAVVNCSRGLSGVTVLGDRLLSPLPSMFVVVLLVW